MNNLTRKLLHDGSARRQIRMNLLSMAIGFMLLVLGVACVIIKVLSDVNSGSGEQYHEMFFWLPISATFSFCGFSVFVVTGIRNTIALVRNPNKSVKLERLRHLKAGEASKSVLLTIRDRLSQTEPEADEWLLSAGTFPLEPLSTEMSTTLVDGYEYIGYLIIPVIDIELPVMADWDYARLRIAPCRQFGSAKTNDLVIAAHNYGKHFGKIHSLEYGDLMFFTDADSQTTSYCVTEIVTLQPTQVDEMKSGDWDITLYTCTYGGKSRVTVRFSEIDTESADRKAKNYNAK